LSTLFTPYEFAGITLTPPTREFEGHLDLTIGGRAVQLIEVGPAHTAGDLVVWVPDVRTCFTADVLFNGETPIMWAGPASNWIAALDTVIALDPAVVVPGHGPVGTVDDLRVMRDYFSWVKRVATPLLEAGQSPSQAATTMLTSAEFAESPWATWDDAARLVVTLEIENRRRRGISKPLVGPARLLAFIRMGRVASALGLLP
ncbi:MAG: MBL fold metallo-hydrolase, partial [Thermoleophilaceae bacterium]|nr:MBL fold metallo-hydrolase [Thermoleophilaceae bacterium]